MSYGLPKCEEAGRRADGVPTSNDIRAGITTANKSPEAKRQARHDDFGARQAARPATFLARHRATASMITAGAPLRTISGVRP
jgi:hypothetical protein